MVGHYFEQWLVVRISAPQGMEANLVGAQIDLAAHQPMRPLAGDLKALAHQVGPSSVVGATQEDDRAAQRSVRIELEALRKGSAWRGLLPAARTACAVGGDVACIDGQKLREVFETMPLPDLGLPQCVEAFNGILKSRLARGREYRDYPQRQAQSADPAYRVRKLMSPLKHCLVIKLSIVGQPQLLPAFAQAGKRCVGGNLQFRPSINFTCPQCYSREQLKQRAVRDLEVFNPIKAIKLGPPRCYLRQIPSPWAAARVLCVVYRLADLVATTPG